MRCLELIHRAKVFAEVGFKNDTQKFVLTNFLNVIIDP